MFDTKLSKQLKALKGKAAEDITAEEIEAVNATLKEEGVNAVVVVAGSVEAFAAQLTAEATERVAQLQAELTTAQEATSERDARIVALSNEVAELKAKVPGGAPTAIPSEQDEQHETDTNADKYMTDYDREVAARQAAKNKK